MSSHSPPPASTALVIDWREVEDLLDELSSHARTEPAPAVFYRQMLARLVPASGAWWGAVWLAEGGSLGLAADFQRTSPDCPAVERAPQPSSELVDAARAGNSRLIVPQSPALQASNPFAGSTQIWQPFGRSESRCLLQLCVRGEVEPAAGRSLLRLSAAAGELSDEFERHCDLRRLREREQLWAPLAQFGLAVHRDLDVRTTALVIANEGRRAVGCDRLSVLVRRGKHYRLMATSGVDVIDPRSATVRGLERLAEAAARTGEPLWYCDGEADLPVEIEQPLHGYLDVAQVRSIAMLPLVQHDTDIERTAPPVGLFVAEQFQTTTDAGQVRERLAAVSEHAALALANALAVSRRPLARLSGALARARWLVEPRQLPGSLLALVAVAAVAGALVFVPADFDIEARGELLPKMRREVFATDDGVIGELAVDHAQKVRAGEPLLVIRKPELDLEFRRVRGESQTAEKKLAAILAERLENATPTADARRRARQSSAEEEELKQQLSSLGDQLEILKRQADDLVVRSPIDGEVMTWNVKRLLEARPVERGQVLLSVADLAGPWELELRLGDHRTGHVLAARELQQGLDVTFALLSDPGREYHGTVSEMAMAGELDDDGRPIVRVTVDFPRDEVPQRRAGATALARIQCGRRSLGFVWLHDLFEFVQSHWWW